MKILSKRQGGWGTQIFRPLYYAFLFQKKCSHFLQAGQKTQKLENSLDES